MSLIISNVKKQFGSKEVFDGFSHTFKERGLYAIVGDSGIGKTTLLRMIAGLDNDYKGKISGGGFQNVSFAFQEYRLFPTLTALQNVLVAYRDSSDSSAVISAKELLCKFGITEREFSLLPSELSGGMKQRVALARAFLKKAPILILDEPTKELDSALKEIINDEILSESKKRLVILVTHDLEDLEKLNALQIKL